MLDAACTQAQFGELVGISQPAVSDLLARDVLKRGDSAQVWLLAYCEHLRIIAAGRDPDGELSTERARVARETADRIAMQNAVSRKEYAPVAYLEIVLGDVARQIAQRLDALVPQIRRRLPDLPPSVLTQITQEVIACRDLCAAASLADAERLEQVEDDADVDEVEHA
jgi:phage terminase Nu1 subunit (DNA packaging protein)